jgi:hypothetical protein
VEAVIATHDIGAVGYFSNRRILDTTGLVTPAVLTYLQPKRPADEGVARFLRVAKPDYLVLIPSWYPALIAKIGAVQPVFEIDVANNTVVAGDRFVAYRTPWSRRVPSPP